MFWAGSPDPGLSSLCRKESTRTFLFAIPRLIGQTVSRISQVQCPTAYCVCSSLLSHLCRSLTAHCVGLYLAPGSCYTARLLARGPSIEVVLRNRRWRWHFLYRPGICRLNTVGIVVMLKHHVHITLLKALKTSVTHCDYLKRPLSCLSSYFSAPKMTAVVPSSPAELKA